MASSSSSRAALAALLLALATSGCWTGRIFEVGRVRESVVEYRSATLTGDSLRVDYTVELERRGGGPGRREPRAARVELAALRAEPEHRVDAFPLERVSPGAPAPGAVPLPLARDGQAPAGSASGSAMVVRVETNADGHELLRLCPAAGGACVGRLYSAALYRDRTAWWVYPLVPLGVAVDVALLPLQLVTTAPFFLAGD